jgi:magnesium transporter
MKDKNEKQKHPAHSDPVLFSTIKSIHKEIENRNHPVVNHFLSIYHPADIAEVIETLDLDDALYLFRNCNKEKQRLIFMNLSDEMQEEFVDNLNLPEVTQIIEELESDEITYLFSDMDKERAEEILSTIDHEDSVRIRTQLAYEENTAGRLMNLDFATVKMSDTARRGIISVRRAAKETDDIYVIFVVDSALNLKGIVKLKDLLISHPETPIQKIIQPTKSIHYAMDQEEVANFFKKYDIVSAPVVDDNGVILGRITIDDVLHVVEEEATEDIYRMGGVSEEESISSSVWSSVRHRLVWLTMNFFIAMVTTSVVTFFEDTIQRLVILASMMPIVAGMGGNAGTQAITIMVRNIATGEITDSNLFVTIRKELLIGLINGFSVGLVAFSVTLFLRQDLLISIVMGMAMLANLGVAGLMGSFVPVILKSLKIDPAIASSIFVTAFTDMFGFFCFLGLANLIIPH